MSKWVVVGVGVGGSDVVEGDILPVARDTEVTIEENSSGQDELSTIGSDTPTPTPTSKSSSTSSSMPARNQAHPAHH